jgi:hypothetical protein
MTIAEKRHTIRTAILIQSRYIQTPNFMRCSDSDLSILFALYDAHFFNSTLSQRLTAPCQLEFSGRLRSSGGLTSRTRRGGVIHYRIAIANAVLFQNFSDAQPRKVTGVDCFDRLDALMRIFEHELLHLHEFLIDGQSNCSAERFQALSRMFFGHLSHKHELITPRQRTIAASPFQPGQRVRFELDNQQLSGTVNRINRRATVLVESPVGSRYTDGKRYKKYYVPLMHLSAV